MTLILARTGSSFLVRTRDLFRDRDVAVAILDTPSDRSAGMNDDFRTGHEHLLDVTAVVEDLRRRFPAVKVFLAARAAAPSPPPTSAVRWGTRWTGSS